MKHLFAFLAGMAIAAAGDGTLFDAIRSGNTAAIQATLNETTLNAANSRGIPPLLYAAAFGNFESLKLLVDAGADVNARSRGDSTALLWAANDSRKAQLLIEHGASVNAQSKLGRTPLIVAASRTGNTALVALLLSRGADANAADRLGITALSQAARAGDLETVQLLLDKGAAPGVKDNLGRSILYAATSGRNPAVVRLIIQRGADVNAAVNLPAAAASRTLNNIRNGPPTNDRVTPLHNAAAFGPVESVQLLLKAGANVNAADARKLGPLSFALATEYPSLAIVRALIAAGAEVNAADNFGDTPLDWAEKFGDPEVIAELKRAGAKNVRAHQARPVPAGQRPQPAIAIERAVTLLETSSEKFFQGSGCVACHHQNFIARAQVAARRTGMAINETVAKEQALQMIGQWMTIQEDLLQGVLPGGGANRLAENLLGLQAAQYAPDTITDTAVAAILASQEPDGSWASGEVQHRPPIAQSLFSSTARIVHALRAYAIPARQAETAHRIARARDWLLNAKPATTEDFSMRLVGLQEAGASPREVAQAAKALRTQQRADGGWAANRHMRSDAYATGVALTALFESKAMTADHAAYRRGVAFLLSTQFPDGSWYVRSRSIKFQPYFESGFPFGHDQWISTAATAWAVQAIAPAARDAAVALTRVRTAP